MARGLVPINAEINLVLLLDKTYTGRYCQAKIYDADDTLVDTINLTEETGKGAGIYQGLWTTPSLDGDYYAVYQVFTDAGYTTLDATVPRHAEETFYVSPSTSIGGSSPYTHTDTIINDVTSNPIDGANVYIYTDALYTNLVGRATTDALGVYVVDLDSAGTYYRKIVAAGYLFENDSIIVT